MAEGKCATCARYILVVFNLLFWVIGILLMGGGIWVLASDSAAETIKKEIHLTIYNETLAGIGYGILGGRLLYVLYRVLWLLWGDQRDALMLAVYIFFMAVLVLGEIAAVIYLFVERSTIEDLARDQLLTDVKNYNSTRKESAIDFIQLEFHCCGSKGHADYYNESAFFRDAYEQNTFVPDSCCRTTNNKLPAIPKNSTQCQFEARENTLNPTQLYTTGCFYMFSDLIDENSSALIGFAAGIMVVAIIGIVFAVFLCRNRTEYDFYDD